jgi:hypothetical protein
MYDWLSSVVGAPAQATPEILAGSVIATLVVLIFLVWVLSRLFKR